MMNDGAGNQQFVRASVTHIVEQLDLATPEATAAIAVATGANTADDIDQHRTQLLEAFTVIRDKAAGEAPQAYVHYASRFDIVGIYQSVLSRLFDQLPGLQGYGDRTRSGLRP